MDVSRETIVALRERVRKTALELCDLKFELDELLKETKEEKENDIQRFRRSGHP